MQREYMLRGKRLPIEEIDNVIGVKTAAEGEARTNAVRGVGERYAIPQAPNRAEWQAFEQAGWNFVQRSAATREVGRFVYQVRAGRGNK